MSKKALPDLPYFVTGGPSTDSMGRPVAAFILEGRIRVDELVNDLDAWIESGYSGGRNNFLNSLSDKVSSSKLSTSNCSHVLQKPGYSWLRLYYRKRHTIRTRLLARGHPAWKLDKAEMENVPDTLRKPKSKEEDRLYT